MHHLTTFEMVCGCIIFFLANVFILVLIGAGFKIAADSRIEEAEKACERKAERRAREIMKDRLDGCRIQVIQRIEVVEDDLKGGRA